MEGYARKEKLRIQVLNTREEEEHFHQDFELLYILEGSMEVRMGEKVTRMKEEDVLMINANKKHSMAGSEDILFVKLLINYELVSDVYQSMDILFWCDSTKDESERFDELRDTLKKLLAHYLNTRGNTADFGHIALCYRVMDILSVNFLVRSADKDQMTEKDRFENRILQINNYIRANYNQPVSLKDLADKLYLSNGYLSRFFKKNYGMSFAEYLSNIRLYHAVDELLYSSIPITRIAYDNGFASVAVFNKSFKKAYGETPSAFRKRSRQSEERKEKDENAEVVTRRLEDFLAAENVKQEKSLEMACTKGVHSVKDRRKVKPFWKQLINGGTAEDLLRSEVREHIILLKDALGFEYLRFWNIFSSQMLIDINSQTGGYNFSRLDAILDFLMQQGIKPHIELGQKPRRIQRSVKSALVFEEPTPAFAGLEQWEQVMDALMRHLQHRYGREEIDTWKMELWLDESVGESVREYEGYYSLFNLLCETIRKYSKRLELGGCGVQTNYSIQLDRDFLTNWRRQKYQPDFISVLNYAYVRGEENLEMYSKRSTDAMFLLHGVNALKALLKESGMEDMKIYVTEWNLTISDRNFINDTCFKGAYIVKNVLDVYGEIEALGYFVGSDRISEHYDSSALLHGGTGLLAKDGILKPAGFAFDFLNQLYQYYVGKGENYLITTDGQNTCGIICHNQKKLNYNYYFTNEDEIEKKHTWKYFEDRDGLELKVQLTDLEDGVYQLKAYRINEQSGSVLDIWAEMDYAGELSRSDIKYFRRVCEPKLTIQKYEVKNGRVDLEVQLEANEIALLRLAKL